MAKKLPIVLWMWWRPWRPWKFPGNSEELVDKFDAATVTEKLASVSLVAMVERMERAVGGARRAWQTVKGVTHSCTCILQVVLCQRPLHHCPYAIPCQGSLCD